MMATSNSSDPIVQKPLFDKVIDGYLTPIVVLFGVIGNCLNLAILGNRKSRSSSAMTLLLGMSAFDLFVLLVQVPHVFFTEIMQFTTPSIEFRILQRQYAAYIRYPFTNIGLTGAGILSATVAIDRYAAIKNVEDLHKIFKKYTKYYTAFIAVFSVLFNSSKFFDMIPNTYLVSQSGKTYVNGSAVVYDLPIAPYRPSDLATNVWYSNITYWLSSAVNTLIPQLIMAVFGSIVVVSFAKLKRMQAKMPSSSRENRISLATRMVVATICVFFVTSFLSLILIAAACVLGREALMIHPVLARLRLISNFLAITKSGMNFILYCSTCAHYRTALRGFFSRYFSTKQKPSQNVRRKLIETSTTRSENKRHSPGKKYENKDQYLAVPVLKAIAVTNGIQAEAASVIATGLKPIEQFQNGESKAKDSDSDGSSPI